MNDVPLEHVVTLADVARRLQVSPQYVSRMAQRETFPEAIGQVGQSRVWDMRAIEAWAASRPGHGGRPKR